MRGNFLKKKNLHKNLKQLYLKAREVTEVTAGEDRGMMLMLSCSDVYRNGVLSHQHTLLFIKGSLWSNSGEHFS